MSGRIFIKDGPNCGYKITFTTNGDAISGYSVTTPPDGMELKARINGRINRKRHTLTFTESKMPFAFNNETCMFDVQLTYTQKAGGYLFQGVFQGHNDNSDTCDAGTISLALTKPEGSPFAVKKEKKVIQREALPAEEPEQSTSKITAKARQEYEWHTDSCVLEIWDGEVVDGDIVTVACNGQKILAAYSLTAGRKRIVVPLSRKENSITIFAENEGKAPPNTSMILLWDGTMQHRVLSCIKGETAEIIIHRH